jgi:hypothetical protein
MDATDTETNVQNLGAKNQGVPPNRPVRPFKKITKDNPRKLKNAEY